MFVKKGLHCYDITPAYVRSEVFKNSGSGFIFRGPYNEAWDHFVKLKMNSLLTCRMKTSFNGRSLAKDNVKITLNSIICKAMRPANYKVCRSLC